MLEPKLHRSCVVYSLIFAVVISCLPILRGAFAVSEIGSAYVRKVRAIETADFGFSSLTGLVFSPAANSFLMLNAQAMEPSDFVMISLHEDLAGSASMATPIDDPLNLAFDGRVNRLLFLHQATKELVHVQAKRDGTFDLAAQAVARFNTRRLALENPQGMTVDPQTGRLFVLDAARLKIVCITPDSNHGFDAAAALRDNRVSKVDLAQLGPVQLRGIAFNLENRHLYTLNPSEKKLYELTETGQVVATRDLRDIRLHDPQALIFAPSGDPTDDLGQMSLYVADSGLSSGSNRKLGGQIVELALTQPVISALPESVIQSSLVNTIDTSQWSSPSTDPSGISYIPSSGRLLICDGEVDEIPLHYRGFNVFEATRSGDLVATFSRSFSDEIVGAAVNPNNGHRFFSDDNKDRVFEVNQGPDGQHGTSDDIVTSINTRAFNSYDPEGVAFGEGKLFIADGTGSEVYIVHPGANGIFNGVAPTGDDQVTHFDTSSMNQPDPESVDYSPLTGTLYIVSNTRTTDVVETTTTGTVLNVIEIGFLNARAPAGVTRAPGSTNPAEMNLYIADRGIDNGGDPNENDGKIYEIRLAEESLLPAAPTDLVATAVSGSEINLFWTDRSINEDGFRIERCTVAGCTDFVEIAQTSSNVITFPDAGLATSTTYTYRVRAFNVNGNSNYSNTASASTLPPPPNAPSNLTATTVSSSRIDLSWSDGSTDETGFKIERCQGTGCTDFVQIAQPAADVTAYNDSGLTAGTTYNYRVRASNSGGNSDYSNTAQATTQSPPTPPAAASNLTASAASTSQINLSWTDNADNEDGFRVERCTSAGCTDFVEIAQRSANVTSFSNTGLSANTTYTYRVRAYNSGGNSDYSNMAEATTQSPPLPTAPSNLTWTAASASQINLSWTDNANNEDGFRVERCTGTGCTDFVEIAQRSANVTSFSNTGLSANTTYTYRVCAYNSGGNSLYSNTAEATTQNTLPAAPTNLIARALSSTEANLTWEDNAHNEGGFRVERCTGQGCSGFVQITQINSPNVTSYKNTGLTPNTTYRYRVRAFNAVGNSDYSNKYHVKTKP